MTKSFCVFILSHGRPGNVLTLEVLRKGGYTGAWRILVDNEDPTLDEYIRRFGEDRVIVFDKALAAETVDTGEISGDRRAVVFARNVCFGIARDLGFEYFLQLDDDYHAFFMRYEDGASLRGAQVTNMDGLFEAKLDFLRATGAASVAFAQGGDMMGGINGHHWRRKISRKAMNSFFCRSDDQWRFAGLINEDVVAYTMLAQRGVLFLTTSYAVVNQLQTQQNSGGLTDIYLALGTYVKSFYSVMMCPSAVKISTMGRTSRRIHHTIQWKNVTPMILDPSLQKSPRTEEEKERAMAMRRGANVFAEEVSF